MKKLITLITAICALSLSLKAQINSLGADVRFDYIPDYGFKGNCISVDGSGDLSEHISYSFKQRLHKPVNNRFSFDATDWVYLRYTLNEKWNFTLGKQVLYLGGVEYNTAPINMYFSSLLYSDLPCYLFGLSANCSLSPLWGDLLFQITESPFGLRGSDMYAYNIEWRAKHKVFSFQYSINAMEYQPKSFIYYAAFGNSFSFSDFCLHLDATTRLCQGYWNPADNFSAMLKLDYNPSERFSIYAKSCLDLNRTAAGADYVVMDGTQLLCFGAGLEYFLPLNANYLRFHLSAYYRKGDYVHPDSVETLANFYVNMGLTFKLKFI